MRKTKTVVKLISFVVIALLGWYLLQAVFLYNWDSEHVTAKYESYAAEPKGSIDVLWIGTSNTYADICPAAMWHESGITSFNMGTANNVSLLEYYQLEYLIGVNKPKLVVMDFSGASVEESPDEYFDSYEPAYRKLVETMPNIGIKLRMIKDFCSKYESLDYPSFLFPLLRYHSRWEELTKEDWDIFSGDESYNEYRKGAYFNSKVYVQEFAQDIFTYQTEPVEMYQEYYQKMLELCKENDIEVLVTLLPKVEQRHADYVMAKEFAAKNNLNLAEFTTVESMMAIGLDPKRDFYDHEHLNILGQNKFSSYIGKYIAKVYKLEDHRGDTNYSEWDTWYEDYLQRYNSKKDDMTIVN